MNVLTCLIVLFISVPAWTDPTGAPAPRPSEWSCQDDLTAIPSLSAEQKSALRELSMGLYSVRVLTKTISNVVRTVVLVGEIHFKSPLDARRAQGAINLFPDRARESGVSATANFWFPAAMLRRIGSGLRKHRDQLSTQGDFSMGSSIHASDASVVVRQFEAIGLHTAHRAILKGDTHERQIAYLRSGYLQDMIMKRHPSEPGYEDLASSIDIERIVAAVERITPETPLVELKIAARPRRTVDLELGYRPRLRDQMFGALWVFADRAKFMTGRAALGAGAAIAGLGTYLDTPDAYVTVGLGLSVLAVRSLLRLGERRGFTETLGNLPARDAHMAERLYATLLLRPQQKDVMVIVGAAHDAGIARNLEDMGFRTEVFSPFPFY